MVIRNCATLVGTAHHFGALMAERGHGGIVAVTSGCRPGRVAHIWRCTGTSKAFDLNFGESLWAELSPVGVDVLAMVLGPTDTPAFRRVLNGRDFPGMADPDGRAPRDARPLGRWPYLPTRSIAVRAGGSPPGGGADEPRVCIHPGLTTPCSPPVRVAITWPSARTVWVHGEQQAMPGSFAWPTKCSNACRAMPNGMVTLGGHHQIQPNHRARVRSQLGYPTPAATSRSARQGQPGR